MSQSQYNQVIAYTSFTAGTPYNIEVPLYYERVIVTNEAAAADLYVSTNGTAASTSEGDFGAVVVPGAWRMIGNDQPTSAKSGRGAGLSRMDRAEQGLPRRYRPQSEPARERLPDVCLASVPDWQHARERQPGVRVEMRLEPSSSPRSHANACNRASSAGRKSQAVLGRFSAAASAASWSTAQKRITQVRGTAVQRVGQWRQRPGTTCQLIAYVIGVLALVFAVSDQRLIAQVCAVARVS